MSASGQNLAEMRRQAMRMGIPLVGESSEFVGLLQAVLRISAHRNATVLIEGETGTGKDLIARTIHYFGDRRSSPFVPVNCGALPETLAENELFGHREGAFTDARRESSGLLRLANKGTLFLDEVDALPPRIQVALLRFMQDGRFRPLGAAREENVDVRIIAASNRCLTDEVRLGRFRADLFYRLNLMALHVPPLRNRRGDIEILSEHFLHDCAHRYGSPYRRVHARTAEWFARYAWPGNVRELENVIHRGYLLCDQEQILLETPRGDSAQPEVLKPSVEPGKRLPRYRDARIRAIEEFDRLYLEQVLRQARGNVTRAAQLAGKERRALGKLLRRYQIDTSTWRRQSGDSLQPPTG